VQQVADCSATIAGLAASRRQGPGRSQDNVRSRTPVRLSDSSSGSVVAYKKRACERRNDLERVAEDVLKSDHG
jgi:hypothetical protein